MRAGRDQRNGTVGKRRKKRKEGTREGLTLLLTFCGLTSQTTHRGGLGLGGLVHEEAHPCLIPLSCLTIL